MDRIRRAPHLQLVREPSGSASPMPAVAQPSLDIGVESTRATRRTALSVPPLARQLSLFPSGNDPYLLGIVDMATISAGRFVSLLENMRPRWLVDLRPVPRFDIDRLNRRIVFDLFQKYQISYRDLAGELHILSRRDASLSSGVVARSLTKMLAESGARSSPGPIFILLDDEEHVLASVRLLPHSLKPRPSGGWATRVFDGRS